MSVTALCIIFNHPFSEQLPLLRRLYSKRFDKILFLLPFDSAHAAEDVHIVYGGGYTFDMMIASSYIQISEMFKKCDFVLFAHNDLLISPYLNQLSVGEVLALDADTIFACDFGNVSESIAHWKWSLRAAVNWMNSGFIFGGGANSAKEFLPSADEAIERINKLGFHCPTIVNPVPAEFYKNSFDSWQKYAHDLLFGVAGEVELPPIDLRYPIIFGYSDFFVVPVQMLKVWSNYVGTLAAMQLFPEVSIPTANILCAGKLKTPRSLNKEVKVLWGERDSVNDFDWLVSNFSNGDLFIHPVKYNLLSDEYLKKLIDYYDSLDDNNVIDVQKTPLRGVIHGAIDRFTAPRSLGGWIKNSELLGNGRNITISVYRGDRLIGKGQPNRWRPDIVDDRDYLTDFFLVCSEDIPEEVIAFERLRIEARDTEGRFAELHIWDAVRSAALHDLFQNCKLVGSLSMATTLYSLGQNEQLNEKERQALLEAHDRYFAEENRRLLFKFESLGFDCSLGGIQRMYGAEPLGLLRFSGVSVHSVIDLLRDGFKGVGAPEYTRLVPNHAGEYFSHDVRHKMSSHTFIFQGDVDFDDFYKKQCKKISFLARNILEKLREGEKIFVVHAIPNIIHDDILVDLFKALRTYGPSSLLYLEVASESSPSGTFYVRDDGIMVGYVLQIQGELTRPITEVRESWLSVCKKASEHCALSAEK